MTSRSAPPPPLEQSPTYLGNMSAADVAQCLRACKNVLVLTHTKPDGDALGSCLALVRSLRIAGVQACARVYPPVPHVFDDMAKPGEVTLASGQGQSRDAAAFDRIVVVDTGSWSQIGPASEIVRGNPDRTIIIDHHVNGHAEMAQARLIDAAMPAACEIVAEVVKQLLDVRSAAALPIEVAEPIYLGIATDTGWFRHPSVLPSTMRLAADLLDAGVDQNALYQRTEQADRPSRLALAQRALASLQYFAKGSGAAMVLHHADFAASGSQLDETGGLIDLPLSVGAVRVAVLLYETEPGRTRISMRSKAGDHPVDVNRIAQQFGGGGHKHAAGARAEQPATDVLPILMEAIESAMR